MTTRAMRGKFPGLSRYSMGSGMTGGCLTCPEIRRCSEGLSIEDELKLVLKGETRQLSFGNMTC